MTLVALLDGLEMGALQNSSQDGNYHKQCTFAEHFFKNISVVKMTLEINI